MFRVVINVQNSLTVQQLCLLIAMAAVALWSTISLTIRTFTTVKRYSGLYFYAILITSWGITVRQIGVLMIYFAPCPWVIRRILIETGWVAMVSGFSVVLYSRLSIILKNRRIRHAVLAMIIFNASVWHPMVITLNGGIRYLKNHGLTHQLPSWQRVHDPVEITQLVMFCTQEIIISIFYVHAAYQYLRSSFSKHSNARAAMLLLILVQGILIAIDLTIILMDVAGHLKLKVFIHSFVYSVKLELEFVTLNQLVEWSKLGAPGMSSCCVGASDFCSRDAGQRVSVAGKQMQHGGVWTRDSGVDLESCGVHSCGGSLDFITVPPNLDVR